MLCGSLLTAALGEGMGCGECHATEVGMALCLRVDTLSVRLPAVSNQCAGANERGPARTDSYLLSSHCC